jgi:hypothetical protein
VLIDPVQGEACIAIEYHAAPPSLLAVQGPGISSRAFTISASQAVDFLLSDGTASVLIRVPERQDDVDKVHRHLLGEYGLQLRSEVLTIVAGDLVRVRGVSDPNALPIGSPYRTPSLAGVIFAERFWVIP